MISKPVCKVLALSIALMIVSGSLALGNNNFSSENNQPPVASFSLTPPNPRVNQTVTFNATLSKDPDGTIASYEWNFGDNTTGRGKMITHSYPSTGNYSVKLILTDDKGATNSTSTIIRITYPIVSAVSIKSPCEVLENESFTATVTIDNVSDLSILMLKLSYNASVITLSSIKKGSNINASLWSHWSSMMIYPGIVTVFAFAEPSGAPIDGSAELARLEFMAISEPGKVSTIEIHGIIGNSDVEALEARWIGSVVNVTPDLETINSSEYAYP
jgi:PKD repeat protein